MTSKDKVEVSIKIRRLIKLGKTLEKKLERYRGCRNTEKLLQTAVSFLEVTYSEYSLEVLSKDETSKNLSRLVGEYL